MMAMQQSSIAADSQNGNAPPPGPSPGIQPMGSSVLFHIRRRENTAMAMAMTSSATRMTV
jgi:hypothetical protein